MTIQEAKYLLKNTAWLAPSLEPIDEAVEMACEALDKVEYINSQLGKADRKIEPSGDNLSPVEDEPQTEYERASEQREHDILYESTYDVDNGSM